jgi:energy-coupling factor transporter ATP-binding protein EcfA2
MVLPNKQNAPTRGTLRRTRTLHVIESDVDESPADNGTWTCMYAPKDMADMVNTSGLDVVQREVKRGMSITPSRRSVVLLSGRSGCGKSAYARCMLHGMGKACVVMDTSAKKIDVAVAQRAMSADEHACGIVVDGMECFTPHGLAQFFKWLQNNPRGPPVILTCTTEWKADELYKHRAKLGLAVMASMGVASCRDAHTVASSVMQKAGKAWTVDAALKLVQALNGKKEELSVVEKAIGCTTRTVFDKLQEEARHDLRFMVSTMEWLFGGTDVASLPIGRSRDSTTQDIFTSTRSFFEGRLCAARCTDGLERLVASVAYNMPNASDAIITDVADDLDNMSLLDTMGYGDIATSQLEMASSAGRLRRVQRTATVSNGARCPPPLELDVPLEDGNMGLCGPRSVREPKLGLADLAGGRRRPRGMPISIQAPKSMHVRFSLPRVPRVWTPIADHTTDLPQELLPSVPVTDWSDAFGIVAKTEGGSNACRVVVQGRMMPSLGVPFTIKFTGGNACRPFVLLAKSGRRLQPLKWTDMVDKCAASARYVFDSARDMHEAVLLCAHCGSRPNRTVIGERGSKIIQD